MIVFKEWLQKLRTFLQEKEYQGDMTSHMFVSTAKQDYDLGISPERSAKIFIQEWTP